MSTFWDVWNHLQDVFIGTVETTYDNKTDARFEARQEYGADSYYIEHHKEPVGVGSPESFYDFPEWSNGVEVSGSDDDCGLYPYEG